MVSLGKLSNTPGTAPDVKGPVWRRRRCNSQTAAGTVTSQDHFTSDRYCLFTSKDQTRMPMS
ncbi:hypothetical protein EKH55_1086 [Sinorhizobium alkalisoli]|nr:hypothetical protein EKH55_1086 [Sinorhizobium alkalisoli]